MTDGWKSVIISFFIYQKGTSLGNEVPLFYACITGYICGAEIVVI